jgi:GR25 family glycosyltransferase involved in LPS biosynthesis
MNLIGRLQVLGWKGVHCFGFLIRFYTLIASPACRLHVCYCLLHQIMKPRSSSIGGAYVPPHRRGVASTPRQLHEDPAVEALCNHTFERILCINLATRTDKWNRMQDKALLVGESFAKMLDRFDAFDGTSCQELPHNQDVVVEWDCTQNAKYHRRTVSPGMRCMTPGEIGCAMSHIAIWRQLAHDVTVSEHASVLILEDDALFAEYRGESRFAKAVATTMKNVPDDWDILYLGFSNRGERSYMDPKEATSRETKFSGIPQRKVRWQNPLDPAIQLYRPTYGFHTHAYAITKRAAKALVDDCLPIKGPIDVWLADNQWFQMNVFCAVIANEGWKLDNGTLEGEPLVRQDRGFCSDVDQSIDHCGTTGEDDDERSSNIRFGCL